MGLMVLAIVVASLASVGGFLYMLCFPPPTSTFLAKANWVPHTSVATAIIVLSAFVALLFGVAGSMLVESMKSTADSMAAALPPQVVQLVHGVRAMDPNITFLDVQCVALLMLLAYGSVLVCKRLIDIQRLLKLSRRRLLRPEMEELKQMDKNNQTPAAATGKRQKTR